MPMVAPPYGAARRLAALCAAVLAWWGCGSAVDVLPSPPDDVASAQRLKLSRCSDYRLFDQGDSEVKARMYQTASEGGLLLIDLVGSPPLLYRPSGTPAATGGPVAGRLTSVAGVEIGSDGLYARLPWPPEEVVELGAVVASGRELLLPAAQGSLILRAAPALRGELSGDQLLEQWPAYAVGAREYRPDEEALRQVRLLEEPAEVYVLFGSWCASCQRFVPNGLRVEQELGQSSLRFRYYAVPEPPEGFRHPEAVRVGVEVVPTAIVYRQGEELGRLVGPDAFRAIERKLAELLERPTPSQQR